MVLKILWMLLTFVSFLGLCGLAKERLQLDDSGTPLIASCIVIIVLMLAGMANVLLWGWWALQVAGLAGFAWVFIAKRKPLSPGIIGIVAALVAMCFIIFRNAYYIDNDAISHWALAAKYLLRTNRFPDAGTEVIHFPSYPLGAAAFIYYFCHTAGEGAGHYIASQQLLSLFSVLPLFGFVRKNRAAGIVSAILLMVCLMGPRYFHYSLVMEALLAQVALGGTFLIIQNRREPRKAILSALPVISTLTFLKSSGLFFSALLCVLLVLAVHREGGKKAALRALFAALAIIALSFVLWKIHFKLAYGNTFTGKHNVSLSNYASVFSEKPKSLILTITKKMLVRLPRNSAYLCCAALLAFTLALALLAGKDRSEWLAKWKGAAALSILVLVIWYFMLYLMYLFSMPADEAVNLDCIHRYEYSGVIYAWGIMALYILAYVCSRDWKRLTSLRWAYIVATALVTVLAFSYTVYAVPNAKGWTPIPDSKGNYDFLLNMKKKNGIEEGKSYFYFGVYDGVFSHYVRCNGTRYEFFSNDILGIYHGQKMIEEGADSDYGYRLSLKYNEKEIGFIQDIRAFLAKHIDEYDYFLVYDYDPEFDAVLKEFLKDYHGDTQVCYSY